MNHESFSGTLLSFPFPLISPRQSKTASQAVYKISLEKLSAKWNDLSTQ